MPLGVNGDEKDVGILDPAILLKMIEKIFVFKM